MDGTLTVPVIDFVDMRRRAGLPEKGGDILEMVSKLDEVKKAKALAAIADVEQEALDNLRLMPGLLTLLRRLDELNMPRALVTRNVERSVHHFHSFLHANHQVAPFKPSITRESPNLRFKPHPDALLHISQDFKCAPQELIMIGDSIKDDIVSGNRAGSVSILIHHKEDVKGGKAESFSSEHRNLNYRDLESEQQPEFVVSSHEELISLLFDSGHFSLKPPDV
jgi:beta-phosphoglucomutase-like phosphatase (HAD superfamily)